MCNLRNLLLTSIIALSTSSADFLDDIRFDCSDISDQFFGELLLKTAPFVLQPAVNTKFRLITRRKRTVTELDPNKLDELALYNSYFDPRRTTVIVTHGYFMSGVHYSLIDMANAFVDFQDVNVILVDWQSVSFSPNYVIAVQQTPKVAYQIRNFLQTIRRAYQNLNSSDHQWHHLYFIGFSVGAHISGQAAYALKRSDGNFFKISRITGLDPAQPCFMRSRGHARLDVNDAGFVDIIHTQTSTDTNFGMGIRFPIGDVDFYINGGVFQAHCERIGFLERLSRANCSHSLAVEYFTEAIKNAKNAGSCKFIGWKWGRSVAQAEAILQKVRRGEGCGRACLEMGLGAWKTRPSRGSYLVITGSAYPYCQFKQEDGEKVLDDIREITTGAKSLLDDIYEIPKQLKFWEQSTF